MWRCNSSCEDPAASSKFATQDVGFQDGIYGRLRAYPTKLSVQTLAIVVVLEEPIGFLIVSHIQAAQSDRIRLTTRAILRRSEGEIYGIYVGGKEKQNGLEVG